MPDALRIAYPPVPNPKKPDFVLPAGTCDTHFHCFGPPDQFPFADTKAYVPAIAPFEHYMNLAAHLGIDRGVVTQPMGHGFDNTIQDVLIRWRRMQGRAALWVPGTDHAGIATQNVVERQLAAEGLSKGDLGREAFVERVWTYVDQTGGQILEQLKAIGCSCDWDRTCFTLDEGLSRAVREIFVRLYEDDLVYRGEYIINWCPRCLTALSNEEAEGAEAEGSLWHLRYPIEDAWAEAASQAAAAGAEADAGSSGDGA